MCPHHAAGAVKDARTSLAALHKARTRHAKLAKSLDAAVLALHGEPASTAPPPPRRASLDPFGPSTSGSSPVATPAAAEAAATAARSQAQAQVQQLLRELEAGSAAYSESLRTHQDALRCLRGQLPKLVQVGAQPQHRAAPHRTTTLAACQRQAPPRPLPHATPPLRAPPPSPCPLLAPYSGF